jgi:hypothetical protein
MIIAPALKFVNRAPALFTRRQSKVSAKRMHCPHTLLRDIHVQNMFGTAYMPFARMSKNKMYPALSAGRLHAHACLAQL